LSDINGLGIQADNDWYQIDVDAGAVNLQVDCRFTHLEGDIDLELYNSSGSFLAGSNGTTDNEFINYAVSSSGTYYINVTYGNAGNAYDLWWTDSKEDTYEQNDTWEEAWHPGYDWERTSLSAIDGLGIQADDDWYRIDVDPGTDHVQVDCQFTHADGDIDISLHDSSGTLLAVSESLTDNEFIDYTIASAGTYYIKVYKDDTENSYDLWWDDLQEDPYEENDTRTEAWYPEPAFDWEGMWLSNIDGFATQTDDDWYQIDVDPGTDHVQVDCRFTHSEGDIDIAIYDSSGTLLGGSNSVTDNEFLDHPISSSGTYYILVYCDDAGNPYDLRWGRGTGTVISGLGETSAGFVDAFTEDYSNANWLRVGWDAYNYARGEARVATGDIDGDGKDEIILGLGPVPGDSAIPNGWFQVLDNDYTHLTWGRINWGAYKSADGESWPACGDVDGDGRDEIIIGLGSGSGGYFEVFDYVGGSLIHRDWVRINWKDYNNTNGETRPACGDVDGDGRDEIVVGLGQGSGGYFEVFDDALAGYAHLTWPRVGWGSYNSANGETRPASGDVDGDGRDEIVVGLGQGSGGYFEVFDDALAGYAHLAWPRVRWGSYDSANGETRPTCGDVEGDGRDEIVVGLGQGAGGYFEVFDDASAGYAHMAWPRVHWGSYCSVNGETWPAVRE
jgi:hypothetical protein